MFKPQKCSQALQELDTVTENSWKETPTRHVSQYTGQDLLKMLQLV